MIMKDPSGAARVNPVPLVDRVRIVLAADARLPYRGQALNYSYPPPWSSMVPGDGGPDVGAFLRADRGCSFM